jgi:hypothetical protein
MLSRRLFIRTQQWVKDQSSRVIAHGRCKAIQLRLLNKRWKPPRTAPLVPYPPGSDRQGSGAVARATLALSGNGLTDHTLISHIAVIKRHSTFAATDGKPVMQATVLEYRHNPKQLRDILAYNYLHDCHIAIVEPFEIPFRYLVRHRVHITKSSWHV